MAYSACDDIKDHGPTVNNASRRKCEYQLLFLSPMNYTKVIVLGGQNHHQLHYENFRSQKPVDY